MATVVLVRHGRTAANVAGVLAGRAAGVGLDEVGREQAARTAERLAAAPLAAVVSSPLMRCRQTARSIIARQTGTPETPLDRGFIEADYGTWQGRAIGELAREPLWDVVQSRPSVAEFPGGEALTAMQARALAALRRHDHAVEQRFGPASVFAVVTHADIIKSLIIDAQGRPLDEFQRIAIAPASLSIVRYSGGQADVLAMNSVSGALAIPSEARR
ncbi:MSMEG_4193 family putative phosphomutase [Gryllotalpicola protaetiae]|uniref:MSMEG_4193 family putative phosphomutase n=1 Tax=Gryllotalpicola protaetiae TaxID=2419771 RepID=A0A387BUX3_9MICO|nr:MSMEG_4193 family putative phosphomutase [Gryllotalpicola protaetiae]AYG04677.1 MSMEG_4193 family putative phosphomutase [Gryllotalpicola protaetiae]